MVLVKLRRPEEILASGSMIDDDIQIRTAFHISGFGISADEISSRLGLIPTSTSEDSPLSKKHRASGYVGWILKPDTDFEFTCESPDDSVQRVLQLLSGKSIEIQSLKPELCAKLVVGVHLSTGSFDDLSFSSESLNQMSDLGLDLVLSIVGHD